ncbi:Adenine/guanine permease AZG1 [Platanthera guangdongensis]|uniref:Adenine/guanine permease AZG1 n=1 Tax=Platanthera guangdongensis TaxID=2320717 RepID=A0ABR2LU01_9ASPA
MPPSSLTLTRPAPFLIASLIGCTLMGFFANLPIALAPDMATNAYFAYSVVGFHGSGRVPYRSSLAVVFLEDLLIRLSIFGDIEKTWVGAKAIGSERDGESRGFDFVWGRASRQSRRPLQSPVIRVAGGYK